VLNSNHLNNLKIEEKNTSSYFINLRLLTLNLTRFGVQP
jgi:hypothetical protein